MKEITIEQIDEIIQKAKASGVLEFEYYGLKFKFRSDQPQLPKVDKVEEFKPLSPLSDLTPEEILYYATPHYDEIQADKKAKAERIEDTHVKND